MEQVLVEEETRNRGVGYPGVNQWYRIIPSAHDKENTSISVCFKGHQ